MNYMHFTIYRKYTQPDMSNTVAICLAYDSQWTTLTQRLSLLRGLLQLLTLNSPLMLLCRCTHASIYN